MCYNAFTALGALPGRFEGLLPMFTKVLLSAATAATISFLFVLCAIVFTDWDGNSNVAEKTQIGCYEGVDHGEIVCLAPKTQTSLGYLGENILLGLCTMWVVVIVMLPILPSERPKETIKVLRDRSYIHKNTPLVLNTSLEQERQPLLPGIDG